MDPRPNDIRVRPDFVPAPPEPERPDVPKVPLPPSLSLASDRARIKRLFDAMDRDRSGKIDVAELEDYFRRLGSGSSVADLAHDEGHTGELHEKAEAEAKRKRRTSTTARTLSAQIMEFADRDEDKGLLDYEEFEAFVLAKEQELWNLFTMLDSGSGGPDGEEGDTTSISGDFKVSKEELRHALREELDLSFLEEEAFINSLMGKEGKDGLLTFQEFRDHFLLAPPGATADAEGLLKIYKYQENIYSLSYSVFGMDMINLPLSASRAEELQGRIVAAAMASTAIARTLTAPLDRIRVYWQLGGAQLVDAGGRRERRARRRARVAAAAEKTGAEAPKPPAQPSLLTSQGRALTYRRFQEAVRYISKDGGLVRGLFRGNTTALVKLPLETAVRTLSLGLARYHIAQRQGIEDYYALPRSGLLLATSISGLVAQCFVHPLDTIRTRMMSGVERLVEGENVAIKSLEVKKTAPAKEAGPPPPGDAKASDGGNKANANSKPKVAAPKTEAADKAKFPVGKDGDGPGRDRPRRAGGGSRSFSTSVDPAVEAKRVQTRLSRLLEARGARSRPNTFWKAASEVYQFQGVRGFYAGLGASLASVVPYVAISDAAYEVLENRYFDDNESEEGTYVPPSPTRVLYMTMVTSLLAESMLYPLQLVRSRMMAQKTVLHPFSYSSTWDCAKQVWQRDGLLGFYKGWGTSVVRLVPAVGVAVGAFEFLKRKGGMRWNEELGIWEDQARY
ncbi:mitochondrial carrier domain-containing protein [Hyaloraphidium curvatum]|nr:mitochondrial carrier domain-containing protein [Hyaloraphidium curvatum]